MEYFSLIFMLLILLGGGSRGGTDLLKTVSTDVYWQIKQATPTLEELEHDADTDKVAGSIDNLLKDLQSDDFKTREKATKELESKGQAILPQLEPAANSSDHEVAAVATALIKKFNAQGRERAILRLMAIRTLGERKEKAALPLLKTLTDSKELFVADYAREAIALMDGKPPEAVDRTKDFQHDLSLLSKEAGVIMQVPGSGPGHEQMTLAKLIDMALQANPAEGNVPPGMVAPRMPDRNRALVSASKKVIGLVERVGNIRIDGLTVSTSANVGPNGGSVILMLRGKYDAPAALETIRTEMALFNPGGGNAAPDLEKDDIPRLNMDEEVALLFPSNEQLVFISGQNPAELAGAVTAYNIAFKAGKGTLADNAELAQLLAKVDQKSPIWAVGKINDVMKEAKILEGFSTITLGTKATQDGLDFTFNGEGSDADKVKGSVDEVNKQTLMGLKSLQEEVLKQPKIKPVVDFLQSIKAVATGASATLTGQYKDAVIEATLIDNGFETLMLLRGLMEEDPPAAEVVPAPVNVP